MDSLLNHAKIEIYIKHKSSLSTRIYEKTHILPDFEYPYYTIGLLTRIRNVHLPTMMIIANDVIMLTRINIY